MKRVAIEKVKDKYGKVRPGVWELRWGVYDPAGKRHSREQIVHGGKRQAEEVAHKIEIEINGDQPVFDNKHTLASWLDHWMKKYVSLQRPKTRVHYTEQVEYVREYPIARVALKKVTPSQLDDFLAELGRRPKRGGGTLASGSVRHVYATLSTAFNKAVKIGEIARSPMENVDAPKVTPVKKRRALTNAECKAYAAAADQELLLGNKAGVLVHLAIDTYFRREDLAGLEWSAINMETGRIEIKRVLVNTAEGGLQFQDPKTEAGKRTVVVSKKTLEVLGHWKSALAARSRSMGDKWEEHNLVFPRIRADRTLLAGKPATPEALLATLRRFQQRYPGIAGDICLHELRHTGITHSLKLGTDPVVVAERAGHSSPKVTMEIYRHIQEEERAAVGSCYDRLIG